jgi:hypothetical protein
VGERGPPGEPGIAPEKVAELERRLAAIEQAGQSTGSATIDSGGQITRGQDGCFLLPRAPAIVRLTLLAGDRICVVEDKSPSKVSKVIKITRREMRWQSAERGFWNCDMGDKCRLDRHSGVRFAIMAIQQAAGIPSAVVDFQVR